MSLANKNVLLGVTGSIAAYKSADLVRRLRDAGAAVEVVLTRAGAEFITPLTLQALSGRPVHTRHLDPDAEAAFGHIDLARWADLVLIAPASANCLAKLANGVADDLLTTLCLASDAPLALAPAMNRVMWAHPATQDNIETLKQRGAHLFGPDSGDQACGETGPGRMLEPDDICALAGALFETGRLAGKRVLITAGPTREALDPVRYLTNRSSGKMGYALANAAAEAGAQVTLVSGPVERLLHGAVRRIAVESAQQMFEAVMAECAAADVFIAAAAVADYRPADIAADKIKKREPGYQLALERTPDILAAVAAHVPRPFVVGFAAETRDVEANALAKLRNKRLDLIVANRVGRPGSGFDSDDNEVTAYWADSRQEFPSLPKERLARKLMELIAERHHATGTVEDS
jgi:phosphopantothenoylcysteine decarboxylase / phosphopantothenate---cysteine ligase